jgi:hypothetical protein
LEAFTISDLLCQKVRRYVTGTGTWLAAVALGAMVLPASAAQAELSLVPKVCVLARGEQLCRDRVDIRWRTDQPLALCLFVDDAENPLRCWQEQAEGGHEYQAETAESLLFQLRQRHSGALLASEIFAVIREHTEYRYRRRNPWSFF